MRLKINMEFRVRFLLAVIYLQTCITLCTAGPLPNITSSEDELNADTCSVGDVVYSLNDDVPGSTPCDRCKCSSEGVKCTQQTCETRPGCKAVHRPDHCCPTYQCECEQEGRRYGNGEKLVDPHDPCRLCYCQGGEVVCRKIACFVRDDCKPRLVPGRCCPEYDNCPLRGVTTGPGLATTGIASGSSTADKVISDSSSTSIPQEIKQEITIKEITPVSEIPAITEVKIKEILPSPSSEVAGFSSSKSPLIPREATSEKSSSEPKNDEVTPTQNSESTSTSSPNLETKVNQNQPEIKTDDNLPSKISFPTSELTLTDTASDQKSEESATNAPVSSTEAPSTSTTTTTTKIPIIEEEENPAFPPIPEDLAVLSNHGDEIVPETHMDADHVSSRHDYVSVVNTSPTSTTSVPQQTTTTPAPISITVPSTTTIIYETSTTERPKDTTKTPEIKSPSVSTEQPKLTTESPIVTTEGIKVTTESLKDTTIITITSEGTEGSTEESIFTTEKTIKDNTGNIFESEPSVTPDFTTELHQNIATSTLTSIVIPVNHITTPEPKLEQNNKINSPLLNLRSALPTEILDLPSSVPETIVEEDDVDEQSQPADFKDHVSNTESSKHQEIKNTHLDVVTHSDYDISDIMKTNLNEKILIEHLKPIQVVESEQENIPTEDTLQTELSSFPIETSDQKPLEAAESDVKSPSTEPPVKEKRTVSDKPDLLNQFPSTKTTESTTVTPPMVEIIQNSTITENKAAIIEPTRKNVFKDFISLVGDVASISDNHEKEVITTEKSITSEQDEKSQMNASYKSKNSNFNQNSITETPEKSKPQSNKQKKVELEEHDDTTVSDGIPPNDKVEPTTKLPIIDDVSEEKQSNEKPEKKDIEIITGTYVPTINKRPSKVVVKKNDKSVIEEHTTEEVNTSTESLTKISSTTISSDVDSYDSTTSSVKLDSTPVTESITQKASSSVSEEATTAKNIESTTVHADHTTEQNMKTTTKVEATTLAQEKTTGNPTTQKIETSTSVETENITGANLENKITQNSTSSNA